MSVEECDQGLTNHGGELLPHRRCRLYCLLFWGFPTDCTVAVLQYLVAMAWTHGHKHILFLLALLCLLAASNLRPVSAETREDGDNAGVKEVEDSGEKDHPDQYVGYDENDFEESMGHGDEEVEEDDEEGEEEDEGEQEPLDETDVIVLGSSNFTAFLAKQRSGVLVAFYAPWCGHCQKLAPEWAAVAKALKGQVAVAKVDATAHSDVGEEFHVNSYPTLLFFLDGMHSTYLGNRSKDAIVNYVHKKMSLTVKALMSESDVESVMKVESPIAVAYLKKLKGPEVFELTTVARQQDDVAFYITSNAEVASMFGFETRSKPALALFKNVPERRLFFSAVLC
ncbi:hypothetical protein M758_12G173900 [Ceratodon purpureus]|nr:hypothetical protein M758_12G173900 [Ceratodon purpureus]